MLFRSLYDLEKRMLKFFGKMSRTDDANKQKEYFLELKKDITVSANEPAVKTAYEYFDFVSWMESKIENRPFAEVVREKSELH